MAQITELIREDTSRRRTNAVAMLCTALVVLGAGWFVVSEGGTPDSGPAVPASSPSPLATGATVGTKMQPKLVAKAPSTWFVMADDDHMVWLDNNRRPDHLAFSGDHTISGAMIYVIGPISRVIDPKSGQPEAIPADGYGDWLRQHPALTVVEDSTVTVDGRQFPQVSVTASDDAGPELPWLNVQDGGNEGTPLYSEVPKDALVIDTVLEVRGSTMIVRAVSTLDADDRSELRAALDLVLSTMDLPD